ncbi:MAG: von Willebrand factor type A domain-containing protein [Chitinophagaceae bacterium]|nr:von Willebrand factor type A domain-containing protein [Chitinophagaceae bacterium]MCW5926754.1 von Willebrand factor type A domain-containing protein [Chitinophagaceae bacterium]
MKYIIISSLFFLLSSPGFFGKDSTTIDLTIKGVVTDENSSPLAGVAVSEKGTGNAVATGSNGAFTITVSKEKAVLVFSFIGYENQEVKLNGQTVLNIQMQPAANELSEVVVMGYATARKSIVGSVRGVHARPAAPGRDRAYSDDRYEYKSEERREPGNFDTEDYDGIVENRFLGVTANPLSTFSIDVDAASYSNVRRFLNQGTMPPPGSVRIEEMINYFQYDYPQPEGSHPFAIHTEIAAAPWSSKNKLVMISLQGAKIPADELPASNLVFLIDVSGSMDYDNKLPLVKQSMKMLTDQLRENDRVAIVVYAGSAGLVLPATSGADKQTIKNAIDNLQAGGSTAGGAGIKLAYKIARENFKKNGNNRVILCTDGDFNVGVSSDAAMEALIEEERKSGVFLTVLGYGMGNYKDNKMQKLANKGNGNHAYIDNLKEAKKVLVNEFGGTLFTIAKDVKLQVEFNPDKVQAYRLIGYENRMLKSEDFNNDKKDAGELGSGHTVTAFYEVIPVGVSSDFIEKVDGLKYRKTGNKTNSGSNEILTVKFRYKKSDGDVSRLIEQSVADNTIDIHHTSDNFRFAAAVAQFGMLLRNSQFRQEATYNKVLALAGSATGEDREGYRKEFIELVNKAGSIVKNTPNPEEEVVGKK